MEQYRIEDIQRATVNGQDVKMFKSFELNQAGDAYIFKGQFSAPAHVLDSELADFANNEDYEQDYFEYYDRMGDC